MAEDPLDALDIASPATLLDRGDVSVDDRDEPVEHEHHADLYDPLAGMAVVGVTDADGRVLLQIHRSEPFAVLPHAPVEPGENWAERSRAAVTETAGIRIHIDGVRRVKRRRYTWPDDDAVTTGYQVFLDASPVGAPTPAPPDEVAADWEVGWHETVPVPATDENAETVADIRQFTD